jgi:hypothetical protein
MQRRTGPSIESRPPSRRLWGSGFLAECRLRQRALARFRMRVSRGFGWAHHGRRSTDRPRRNSVETSSITIWTAAGFLPAAPPANESRRRRSRPFALGGGARQRIETNGIRLRRPPPAPPRRRAVLVAEPVRARAP